MIDLIKHTIVKEFSEIRKSLESSAEALGRCEEIIDKAECERVNTPSKERPPKINPSPPL
ncbi:MAG: hypothetical protein GWN93_26775 [Deltaproteobacteria bacterium]|nr:hypothetical protein [Deltaproteobacteria bacterium]